MAIITINISFLKIVSSFFNNIGAALFLSLFTIRDPWVLFKTLLFVIISLSFAYVCEEFINQYARLN
ncbi:hypothetical protein COY88_01425 [Candidatus Roizmanbacteria bacterium CG_4_10_14_0_8_um_filter_35_28]|uniref:Uncharacterized protein n=3 Tax=Candidatus Roizmaniibacteriota TaxID=1752723 RepID=A0A2M8F157_9BACT|nr:MAG: hypothetical protein COX47_02810 [Candidatus Roizmanbacteria bacterium CG23_combo_of_CG06-09_8_20_14_all_35_49]PIY71229.1 MAG: hypothetical protein COY88_01425 [Candidatus Roizmanbacteria bacterium CG_4_10_14_0_8_um_filter_35_28]PJC33021.1 MAG: hypothetical protein CO048_03920 [Candidatus Roizmanbacteria bacterium CG_4_9_14_0_2_um_filter_35_15]PJC82800.1 MAG: hypothetical protein CO006_01735 [Candidatus Roizmanbacteria bacterium CG_4_8_14_3_um_filter_35_14]